MQDRLTTVRTDRRRFLKGTAAATVTAAAVLAAPRSKAALSPVRASLTGLSGVPGGGVVSEGDTFTVNGTGFDPSPENYCPAIEANGVHKASLEVLSVNGAGTQMMVQVTYVFESSVANAGFLRVYQGIGSLPADTVVGGDTTVTGQVLTGGAFFANNPESMQLGTNASASFGPVPNRTYSTFANGKLTYNTTNLVIPGNSTWRFLAGLLDPTMGKWTVYRCTLGVGPGGLVPATMAARGRLVLTANKPPLTWTAVQNPGGSALLEVTNDGAIASRGFGLYNRLT